MSDRWQEGRQEASGVVGFFISIKFLTLPNMESVRSRCNVRGL